MIEGLWVPGLAVLAAGLAVGVWAARRLAAGARGKSPSDADRRLAIADLEARRDQLYARLRGAGDEIPSEAERRELELAAARTLKELDALGEQPKSASGKRKGRRKGEKRRPIERPAPAAERPAAAPAGGFSTRHPLVAGFLLGAGMVAVIGVLIYWAVRDAQPTDAPGRVAAAPPAAAGALPPDEAHAEIGDLPITLAVELDSLNARIAAGDPDLMARRERALFFLGIERYVEAFEDSRVLLAADPQDIDGLYVQGVVRLTMGQDQQALELFDRVIGLFPNHVQALVWRGILLFRGGDRDGALAAWRRGLEAAGGSQPEIEDLIRTAEQTPVPPAATGAAPPAAAQTPAPAPAPAPSVAPAVASDAFGVRVTIADGAFPPPGGILFVSLRPAAGGPPVAVKRVDRVASFPLDLTISAADSMMGQELPKSGIVRVRLDADGSASTRSPDDLEAEVEAQQGSTVRLVLGAS